MKNTIEEFDWTSCLYDNERIFWTGEPVTTSGATSENKRALVFSLLYLIGVSVITLVLYRFGGEEQRFGIAACGGLIAVGVYLTVNTLYYIFSGNYCVYAITNNRILSYNVKSRKLSQAGLLDFNRIYTKGDDEGLGSIRFVFYKAEEGVSSYFDIGVAFDNIPDVYRAERTIKRLKKRLEGINDSDDVATFEFSDDIEKFERDYIVSCIADDEKILWAGKPNGIDGKLPNMLCMRDYVHMVIAAVIVVLLFVAIIMGNFHVAAEQRNLPFCFGMPVLIVVFLTGFDAVLNARSRLLKTIYVVTDKRIISFYDRQATSTFFTEKTEITPFEASIIAGNNIDGKLKDRIVMANIPDAQEIISIINGLGI